MCFGSKGGNTNPPPAPPGSRLVPVAGEDNPARDAARRAQAPKIDSQTIAPEDATTSPTPAMGASYGAELGRT